ncbi:MAG TPA: hypothetical protein VFL98_03240 [Candidatus Paceibacterota bacterium]|nr:hypothetical protein [Candidatus Paceibacterota bacterium]
MSSKKEEVGADALLASLIASAYTLTDAHACIRALADAVERSRFGAAAEDAARAALPWGAATMHALAGGEDAHDTLTELARRADALPVLVLYVPAALSAAGVERLGRWCRANIDPSLMLSLHTDPAAAGGCIFAWQDHLHDFSLSYFLAKERDAFSRVLAAHAPAVV